jgi:hypothetical protein
MKAKNIICETLTLLKCIKSLVTFFVFCVLTLQVFNSFSQNVSINITGTPPNASAGLDVDFANKGLLIPRVSLTSTTDVATIPSPATSLLVYNNNPAMTGGSVGYWYWNGSSWVSLIGGGSIAWLLAGNAGTTPGTNFLGTTDAKDLVFKTNNSEKMRVLSGGNVGVGTASPSALLEVYGSGSNNSAISMRSPDAYPCTWMFNFGHNNNGLLFDTYYVMGTGWISSSNTANFAIYNNPSGNLQFNYATGVAAGSTITAGNMNNAMTITNSGRVGIGTTTPGTKLEIDGTSGTTLKIVDGNQGAGKVLTSDASGVASWGTVGGSINSCTSASYIPKVTTGGSPNLSCSQIYDNGTYVFISPTAPATGSPFVRLQIGEPWGNMYQTWPANLRQGILIGYETDDMYIGLSDEGSDNSRAVIVWGDNYCGEIPDNDLRFMTHDAPFGTLSEKVRITGCGNFGIGNSSPTYRLDVAGDINFTGTLRVAGNSGTAGQVLTSNGAGAPSWTSAGGGITGSGTATRVTFWSGASSLSSSANLYWDNTNSFLGIMAPTLKSYLTVGNVPFNNSSGTIGATDWCYYQFGFNQSKSYNGYTRVGALLQTNDAAAPFFLGVNFSGNGTNTQEVAILQTGHPGVANDGTLALQSEGGYLLVGSKTYQNTYKMYVNGTLGVNGAACGSVGWAICSDSRYKKDILPLTNSLDNVLKIQGVTFNWKTKEFPEKHFTDDNQIGFIAQDMEKVYPEIVFTDKDGYKSVDYSRLTPVLVEAIKEQQKMIESLTLENQELNAHLGTLSTEIEKIKQQLELDAKK